MEVQEKPLMAQIIAPSEVMSGMPVRFVSQFVGPCASVEWSFGGGTTSTEENPLHSFSVRPGETNTFNVGLRATSPAPSNADSRPRYCDGSSSDADRAAPRTRRARRGETPGTARGWLAATTRSVHRGRRVRVPYQMELFLGQEPLAQRRQCGHPVSQLKTT